MYTILFYLILILEIIFWPILFLYEEFKKLNSYLFLLLLKKRKLVFREKIDKDMISVCIHEWGGYEPVRQKILKNGSTFKCGLKFQLERFSNYCGRRELNITVTMSDAHLYNKKEFSGVNIIEVNNKGMDFSGYSTFLSSLSGTPNHYVILTNTSVEESQLNFIDEYIEFFEKNPNVGLLGISYSSKIFQSLIRNNFYPHAQSFFLLSTLDVLNKVVLVNNGFPGGKIDNKRLLIRLGEVRLSQIVLKLGYALAFVLEDEKPYIFNIRNRFDNGYATWKLSKGDYRSIAKQPNKINYLNLN